MHQPQVKMYRTDTMLDDLRPFPKALRLLPLARSVRGTATIAFLHYIDNILIQITQLEKFGLYL